jgi:hypothetical protein
MKNRPDVLKNDVDTFINAAKDQQVNKDQDTIQEAKKLNSKDLKNLGSEELSIKRSYTLKPSTIRKLQELKVFVYQDPNITYNEIVDDAICLLYGSKKGD